MELFDVIDSKGNPAGQIVSREKAHAEGNLAVAPIHRWSGWGLRLFSGNFRQVIE